MYLNPELPPCDGIKRMDDRLLPSPHITGKELQAEFPHRTQRKASHKTDMAPQNTDSGPTIFPFMMAWCHTNKKRSVGLGNGSVAFAFQRSIQFPGYPQNGVPGICGQNHDGRIPSQEIHRRLLAPFHQRPVRTQHGTASQVEISYLPRASLPWQPPRRADHASCSSDRRSAISAAAPSPPSGCAHTPPGFL